METIKDLREKVHGERIKHNPWYGRLVVRKVSIYLTWILLHTSITANQVTLTVILVGWAACLFFIIGSPVYLFIGACLLQVWWLFDRVDGEIAAYKGEQCMTGTYFDIIAHYLVHPLVMFSLGIGLYQSTDNYAYLTIGGVASFSALSLDIIHHIKFYVMFHDRYIRKTKLNIYSESKSKPAAKENISKESLFSKLLKEYCLYPGVMNLITLAAFMDFASHFFKEYFSFSFLGLLIISYAVFYPISCLKILFRIVNKKEIDKEYFHYVIKQERTHIRPSE